MRQGEGWNIFSANLYEYSNAVFWTQFNRYAMI